MNAWPLSPQNGGPNVFARNTYAVCPTCCRVMRSISVGQDYCKKCNYVMNEKGEMRKYVKINPVEATVFENYKERDMSRMSGIFSIDEGRESEGEEGGEK